jgi:hypothetical protein
VAREVARVIYFRSDKGVPTQRRTTSGVMTTKLNYVVRAECSASRPGTTMTYILFDASRPRAALGGRAQVSKKVSCDAGKVTLVSTPKLVGDGIQMRFINISDQVTRAYAVLVPE